jgi:mRNA interferase HigB
VVRLDDPAQHNHVPLLLSPFGTERFGFAHPAPKANLATVVRKSTKKGLAFAFLQSIMDCVAQWGPTVHVISRKKLVEFSKGHHDAGTPLDVWYRTTKKALWANLSAVKVQFPHADLVGTCVVFNIGGNKYRLITRLAYATSRQPEERPCNGSA